MQIYFASFIDTSSPFFLSEVESFHLIKVLRHQVGDIIHLTDGKGLLVKVQLLNKDTKALLVKYIETVSFSEAKNGLHIAISPTKNMDRLEWFIEKACEVGIQEITPVLFSRTERKKIPLERVQKIVISASKQSKNLNFCKFNDVISFEKFMQQDFENQNVMIAKIGATSKISDLKNEHTDSLILIGPEADFTEQEIKKCEEKSFQPICLSSSILRVETAGIAAVAQYNMLKF
jgi:16S rRNA (uracil1498-N3)-methyltransferase